MKHMQHPEVFKSSDVLELRLSTVRMKSSEYTQQPL